MVTIAWAGSYYYYIITFNPSTKVFTSKGYNSLSPFTYGNFKKAKILSETDIFMSGYLYNIVNEPGLSKSFSYS